MQKGCQVHDIFIMYLSGVRDFMGVWPRKTCAYSTVVHFSVVSCSILCELCAHFSKCNKNSSDMAELSLTVLSSGMHWSWHVGMKASPLTVS